MATKLVIRHGKTDANRLTRAAFGKEGAPLNSQGREEAHSLTSQLAERGINLTKEVVAVSELKRTTQTALEAGFVNVRPYALLNEVNTNDPARTQVLVAKGELPPEALEAAKAIIENPPQEAVWVTHGLVIAALEFLLGVNQHLPFIPNFCEIRELIF